LADVRDHAAAAAPARIGKREDGRIEVVAPGESGEDRWLIELRARKVNPA